MKDLAKKLYNDFEKEAHDDFANIDRSKIIDFYKDIRMALFLNYYKSNPSIDEIDKLLTDAKLDFCDGIKHLKNVDSEDLFNKFTEKLTEIRDLLNSDIKAMFDGDPASNSYSEIVLSYPGFIAISAYRIGHVLYELGLKSTARIISEHAHSRTGIDINPGAKIGHSFFIDHGTGIVIGETAIIGNNVKIYQGVTLGAKSLKEGHSLKGTKRHPTIEDNVTIYSGASILGGETVIKKGAVIGSNVFITESIEENEVVKHNCCGK